MSLELVLSLFGLAVVDSINPSALLVTGYLIIKSIPDSRLKNVSAYIAGIIVSYFILGAVILLGLSSILEVAKEVGDSRAAYVIQALFGACMLLYAIFAPPSGSDSATKREALLSKVLRPRLLFISGVYVTAVELITALPYFAALSLLANAQLNTFSDTLILAAYCLIFVLPPMVITSIYYRNRASFENWYKKQSARRAGAGRETFLWILGVVGFVLLGQAVAHLVVT